MEQNPKIKFIPDEEIILHQQTEDENGNDLLNTSTYVDALVQCIKSAPSDKTFTIGLFGEWGSGKSSIVKTALDKIECDAKSKKEIVKCITYDSWKYAGDSFRRMFLYELRKELGCEPSELMARFYAAESRDAKIETKLNGKRLALAICYVFIAILTLIIIGLTLGWKVAIPSGVAFVSLGFSIYNWMFDNLKVSINKPLLFAPEQFEECYHEMLSEAMKRHNWVQNTLKWITKGKYNKEISKLIIVIDNIDRCQTDVTYSLLSDIKSFLGDSQDVIFIVPVDVNALRKHIINHSKDSTASHDADEFLRKFFNVSVWIKSFQNDEMFDFTQNLNKKYELNLNSTSISVISREFATNPRRIIQLLNNLVIEFTHYDADFLTNFQSLVCLLTIIKEEYPDDMKKIVQNPVLLFDYEEPGTDQKPKVLSNEICILLRKTRSVFENLYESREVIDRILSNSNVFDQLPRGTEDALYTADMEALRVFIRNTDGIDQSKVSLLKTCLCDRIKKAVDRGTFLPDLSNYVLATIGLQKEGYLTKDDYVAINNVIHDSEAWDNIVSDLMPRYSEDLVNLAIALFNNKLTDLKDHIQTYIQKLDLSQEKLTDSKVESVLNVSSLFVKKMISIPLIEQFSKVYTLRPIQAIHKSYKEPRKFFTSELIKNVIDGITLEDFGFEETPNWQFCKICALTNMDNEALLDAYLKKVSEVMPTYEINSSTNGTMIQVLTGVNETLEECLSVHLQKEDGIRAFISKLQRVITVNNRYGSNTLQSLYRDSKDNKENLREYLKLLKLSGYIYKTDLLFAPELLTFLLTNEHVKEAAASVLVELSEIGCPIEKYAKSIASCSIYDDNHLKLLSYCFNNPEKNEPRVSDEQWIKDRIVELVQKVIDEHDERLAQYINRESSSEYINSILTEHLSTLDLNVLETLPVIREKAVKTFEEHIDEYKENNTVLNIIGRCGSRSAIHSLIQIIVNKLTDHREVEALELIQSLWYCNDKDRRAILATIETIDLDTINQESRDGIVNKLDSIKTR